MFFSFSFASFFDEAKDAIKKNEFQKAIKLLKKSARQGNDNALFELGKIYFEGKIVKKDLIKAMEYFKMVADYGNIKAKYNVATIYARKDYKEHNYIKAYNIFLELAKQNHGASQNKIGLFLLHGLGEIDKDYKKALKWFEYAYFKNRYKPAVCNLSYMFANGYGAMFNFGRAAEFARIGIKEGYPFCKKVYDEYKLHKYKKDKGFKYFRGYYSDFKDW